MPDPNALTLTGSGQTLPAVITKECAPASLMRYLVVRLRS